MRERNREIKRRRKRYQKRRKLREKLVRENDPAQKQVIEAKIRRSFPKYTPDLPS